MFKVPEKHRVKTGMFASDESYGNNGVFLIPFDGETDAQAIVSDGEGWEHVSVVINESSVMHRSNYQRTPTWKEMCRIKDLFWSEDDVVIQYHPAKKDYVNVHNHCLHLWRPIGITLPTPPKSMVG